MTFLPDPPSLEKRMYAVVRQAPTGYSMARSLVSEFATRHSLICPRPEPVADGCREILAAYALVTFTSWFASTSPSRLA